MPAVTLQSELKQSIPGAQYDGNARFGQSIRKPFQHLPIVHACQNASRRPTGGRMGRA